MSILSQEAQKEITSLILKETRRELADLNFKLDQHLEHHRRESEWTRRNDNSYQNWSAEEEQALWLRYKEFLKESASLHNRGVYAIYCRMEKFLGIRKEYG